MARGGSGGNPARDGAVFGSAGSVEPGDADATFAADLVEDPELAQDLTVADGDLPGLDLSHGHDSTDAPVAVTSPAVTDAVGPAPGLLARLHRLRMTPAVTLSFAAHVVLAAAFMQSAVDEMKIAGGEEISVTIIGADVLDALKAGETVAEVTTAEETGEPSRTLEAVETASLEPVAEPVTEPIVEPALQPVPVPVAQPVIESVEAVAEEAVPQEAAVAAGPAPLEREAVSEPAAAEAVPAPNVQELAAIADPAEDVVAAVPEPVEAVMPVEDAPGIANVPIPQPRPEPPKADVAKAVAPERARSTASPRPERRVETPARKPQKAAETPRAKAARASKPARPKAGDGGAQAATASKGSSGAKAAGKTSQAGNAAVSNYPGKVASKLRRSLRYPREARGGKLRGEVLVSFVVGSNGSVSSVRVARSSGSPILDRAAGDAVRRAAPFPPIPANAGRSNWSFSVPLAFTR